MMTPEEERKAALDIINKFGGVSNDPRLKGVQIGGKAIDVVKNEEAEKAAFRLCSTRKLMADCAEGNCEGCGCTIYFTSGPPYKPKKVCAQCLTTISSVL